jgi:hypothetical protein
MEARNQGREDIDGRGTTSPAMLALLCRFASRAGAVFQLYCCRLAGGPGAYSGLPSIPDGVPVGVLILLATFVIMRRVSAPRNRREVAKPRHWRLPFSDAGGRPYAPTAGA